LTAYQLPVGEGSVAIFQTVPVELAIATGIEDAIKQATAIKLTAATMVQNRLAGVFLKSVPLGVFQPSHHQRKPLTTDSQQVVYSRLVGATIVGSKQCDRGALEIFKMRLASVKRKMERATRIELTFSAWKSGIIML
jgi:hypothetical protein